MKKLIALSFLLFLIGCGKEVDNLVDRNGIKFEKNSTTPYTGKFKKNYATGKLEQEVNYKNGKREGLLKGYHTTGKLEQEENYKNGKEEGVTKEYYENGKLEKELSYKNGKLEGVTKNYYYTGKLKE